MSRHRRRDRWRMEFEFVDVAEPYAPGQASGLEEGAEEHEHPAGRLYTPDLTDLTGWGYHLVPREQPRPNGRRRVGFNRHG